MADPSFTNQDAETERWEPFQVEMAPDFPENEHLEVEMNQNDDGLGCGFMVDKIELEPYVKAIKRKLVPFAAFFPVGSSKSFLLKISDLSGDIHLLVPATKSDVLEAISQDSHAASIHKPEADKQNVAIVAFVKQTYNKADGAFEVSIEAPNKKLAFLNLLDAKDFTDYAIMVPSDVSQDGNEVQNAEQSNPKESEEIEEAVIEDPSQIVMPTLVAVNSYSSPPPLPSQPDLVKPINAGSSSKEGVVMKLVSQITIKLDTGTVNEVTHQLAVTGLCTPPGPAKKNKRGLSLFETPLRAPPSGPPAIRRSFRRTKKELMDEDNEDISKDPTFDPHGTPQQPANRKRGRPRKLIFEDCEDPQPDPKKQRLALA